MIEDMDEHEEIEIMKFVKTEFAVFVRTGKTGRIIARCSSQEDADRIMRALIMVPRLDVGTMTRCSMCRGTGRVDTKYHDVADLYKNPTGDENHVSAP